MTLFTVVLEFDGGTYISQVRSATIKGVNRKYAEHVTANEAIGKLALRRKLAEGVRQDKPVAIEGVRNVWCCCVSVGKRFGLMNVVATSE